MAKAFLRLTIIGVAIYFIVCYFFAQCFGIDLLVYSYVLLFELCITLILFEDSSKYFCRYMRWTMLSVLISDTMSHADYYLNFVNDACFNIMMSFILFSGFGTSCFLAIRHFRRVLKLKKLKNGTISN